MSGKRDKAKLAKLQAQCDDFNKRCPMGGSVVVRLDSGEERATTTRSPAQVLSGHTPVIWLDGIAGCYLLDRVSGVPDGEFSPNRPQNAVAIEVPGR